jgi:PAS domain S-box-containing protein
MSVTVQQKVEILHVDTDADSAKKTATTIEEADEQFAVETATSVAEGIERITDRPPDCVVSGYDTSGIDGLEFLRAVREEYSELPFILVTDESNESVVGEALSAGATDYLLNPSLPDRDTLLVNRIQNAVEQYQVETRLREMRDEYAAVFENAQNGLLLVDVEDDGFRYQRCNPRAVELIGRDESEIVGQSPREALGPENGTRVSGAYRTCIDQREPVEYVLTMDLPVGEVVRECQVSPVQSNGDIEQLVVAFHDVTERKERERQLQQERRRYTTLFETLPNPVLHARANDGEPVVETVNPAFEDTFGYDAETIRDEPVQNYILPDDQAEAVDQLNKQILTGDAVQREVQRETTDGIRTFSLNVSTRNTETETVEGYAVYTDITERKEREQKLENLKTQYQTLVESFPDGAVFLYDADHQVVRAGGAELSAVGLSPAELERTVPQDRYPPEIAAELVENIDAAFEGERNTFHQTYQGEHYQIQMVPVRTDEGQITHCMAVSRNVTERKERERELRRKTRAIEEAPVGITITDPTRDDNPTIYVNEMFCSVTGYSKEETLGRNYRFLQGEETSSEPVETLRTGIDSEEPVSAELVNYRTDGTKFWNRVDIAPVYDDAGELVNFVGFQQDVTERKERERALQKRERILRELHAATREFFPPDSETAVTEFLVEFVEKTFDFEYVSVKLYDGESGSLRTAARSVMSAESTELGEIRPGTNPVWEAYREGTPRIVENEALTDSTDGGDRSVTQALAVPIGDFGVVVACTTETHQFHDVDTDLMEVVTATAESSFQRLRSESVRTELSEELTLQQAKANELRTLVETIQTIQRRLANSDTREELETGVCEELLETDRVDFAWIGRPRGRATHLDPSTWAGEGAAYLDSVDPSTETTLVPAQRATDTRDAYTHPSIPSLVVEESWAKEALSFEFNSVLSVPLVYDDVVYGVLTTYSHDENAFDTVYESLLSDVASLLVNYGRILDHRYDEESQTYTELEFELTDTGYPLQHIATQTESTIRFEAVVENGTDELRILVMVLDGDVDEVLGAARRSNSVVSVDQFGSPTQSRLTLTVQKPFLASTVSKHNGELVQATSDAASTTFRVLVPRNTSNRPLLDALSSAYREIEPVAQRQTDISRVLKPDTVAEILTDRQYEILTAAYHGGYYDTPRQVTGEDLAESFSISGSAIHKHLQSAHRTLLDQVL